MKLYQTQNLVPLTTAVFLQENQNSEVVYLDVVNTFLNEILIPAKINRK